MGSNFYKRERQHCCCVCFLTYTLYFLGVPLPPPGSVCTDIVHLHEMGLKYYGHGVDRFREMLGQASPSSSLFLFLSLSFRFGSSIVVFCPFFRRRRVCVCVCVRVALVFFFPEAFVGLSV